MSCEAKLLAVRYCFKSFCIPFKEFKLLDSPSNRHIVQIFNEDESQLITTILAIPNYRLRPAGKTTFEFWETPAGEPTAMRAWFYPGDNFGQEFAYPKSLSVLIAKNGEGSGPDHPGGHLKRCRA